MSKLSETNETLKQALLLARENPGSALALLDDGLVRARSSGDHQGVAVLARNAGLVSAEAGNDSAAVTYYEEALRYEAADAYLHFAHGGAHLRLGQLSEARFALERSFALATEQQDGDLAKMASDALAALDSSGG